ncbi:MAG: hypothetical protein PF508_11100 [Spirochaeta sp.]|jgi:hypothetical protein|nr:hypothetical protein [Spirochaeta sp.]
MAVRDVTGRHRERETALLTRYIRLLEAQREAITRRDIDYIDRIIIAETEILSALDALNRVALPGLGDRERPVAVQALYDAAGVLHHENRNLLSQLKDETGRQIADLRLPPQRRSVFSGEHTGGGLVDIHF